MVGAWVVTGLIAAYGAIMAYVWLSSAARRLSPSRKARRAAVQVVADTLMRDHRAGAYDEASRRLEALAGEGGDSEFAEEVRREVARREGLNIGVDLDARLHYQMPRLSPPAPASRFRRVLHPLGRFWRDLVTPPDARWFADFEPGRNDDADREQAWRQVRAYIGDGPVEPAQPVVLLTRRQIDCLTWAARGKSSTDIAAILDLSPHTVDEYLGDACRRLGVRTRVQAVMTAAGRGLIPAEKASPQH